MILSILSSAMFLSSLAAYAYAVVLVYEAAYCTYFAIPISLINPTKPRIVVDWILILLCAGATVAAGSILFSPKPRSATVWYKVVLLVSLFLVWIFVFVGVYFSLGLMSPVFALVCGAVMLIIYIFRFWVPPRWQTRLPEPVQRRLDEASREWRAQDASMRRTAAFRQRSVNQVWVGAFLLLLWGFVILAGYMGTSIAEHKVRFAVLCVTSEAQPQGIPVPLVVLYDNGDLLVCTTLGKPTSSGGHEVARSFRFLDRSTLVESRISMQVTRIGPLQLAPESNASKPVPPSTSLGIQ